MRRVGHVVERHEPGAVADGGGSRLRASSMARLVLPIPPGPVSVTSRWSSSSVVERGELRRAPDERRQPIGQVAVGRLATRSGGNSVRQPGNVELEQVLRRPGCP